MGFLGLSGSGSTAGADSPYGFISHRKTSGSLGRKGKKRLHLLAKHVESAARIPLRELLPYAKNCPHSMGMGRQGAFGRGIIGFTEKLAPLRMASQRKGAAKLFGQ